MPRFTRLSLTVLGFLAGFSLALVCRHSAAPKSLPGGAPSSLLVAEPVAGGAARVHRLRVVRVSDAAGEPVEVAPARGAQLWRVVLPGGTLWCEAD